VFLDESGYTIIEPGDDFLACAEAMAVRGSEPTVAQGGAPALAWEREPGAEEFALYPGISAELISAAALAGFMPMGVRVATPSGPQDLLLAKLHTERCLLDPREVVATKTARAASRRYALGRNARFGEVLESCAEVHGEGWLVPGLRLAMREAHERRAEARVAFVSIELYSLDQEGAPAELVAGEIGYAIGRAYASLTGFHTVSGAGTVQLVLLGELLALQGYSVWDLGMTLDYKLSLGARALPREIYRPALLTAYSFRTGTNLKEISCPTQPRLKDSHPT